MKAEYALAGLRGRRNPYVKALKRGTNTSSVEVSNISPHGVWLYVKGKEYFLSYKDFPWFKNARLSEIQNVRLIHGHNLRWEDLDIDLVLESLDRPDRYPLKDR